ncbi:DUF1128 domain-containing protein [Macrococcus sp. DPC7161]|uniref:DUF1128 domain-containing protein n=1 Tax=Macrococcus sp. DPC7161 TaxID=2507060 RepID=UPI00100C323C|nr:DUF1128 domain-containing protein [Macrococcus sp. DPC7161]RXK17752.1 DUF1128 domain-containing protein [Macrococcus sp. DPC7161]
MDKAALINGIAEKLKLVNIGVINPDDIDDNKLEDLQDLYDYVQKKSNFSPNEMAAITDEIGNLRK